MSSSRYRKSMAHLIRAEETIPLGSQTFSKSRTQYPVGISPLYIDRAKGASVWDVDGNEYIDLVNSLASVTLGYGDPDVDHAVRKQLEKGVSFSLPGILEAEVAELIVEMIPSAEMVRFGKNGSDATSAAIRLARAYTGRDHVAVCGYHGWQDWYIGSTARNKGVPESVSALTHKFIYNDVESLKSILEALPGKIAAIIMEPMTSEWPAPDFLEAVRGIASMAGAVLIFDETLTGFRYAKGGAQELFSVTPDLSTFGKGMANGFPISAVVGKREIMMEMEEIFFSATFGGELLSLAAAKVVLQKHASENVCQELVSIGENLASQVEKEVDLRGLSSVLSFSGHASWKFLHWTGSGKYDAAQLRTFFMQEMFSRGVLILGTHNVSLADTNRPVDKIMEAYSGTLQAIAEAIENGDLEARLHVKPLIPLFQVR
jgi:glutamate-1-semialdehyde 2,1-aminomutase